MKRMSDFSFVDQIPKELKELSLLEKRKREGEEYQRRLNTEYKILNGLYTLMELPKTVANRRFQRELTALTPPMVPETYITRRSPPSTIIPSIPKQVKVYERKRERQIEAKAAGYGNPIRDGVPEFGNIGYSLIPEMEKNYPRYVTENKDTFHYDSSFFNSKNILYISAECTRLLKGVHPRGLNIIVSDENIKSVMDSVAENNPRTSWDNQLRMVVAFIVSSIKIEFETIDKNEKLNIDVIQYAGDYGIRKTPMIKLNEKRPTAFIFNPRY